MAQEQCLHREQTLSFGARSSASGEARQRFNFPTDVRLPNTSMAFLKVTDASGHEWQYDLDPQTVCSLGRAPDNCIVLDDPRASRHHAHIRFDPLNQTYQIVDGVFEGNQIKRSANKVYINGQARFEYVLNSGDRILIGGSQIGFEQDAAERAAGLRYDDKPLGHTQLLISANDVMSNVTCSDPSWTT